jgi:hypothetical protein
VNLYCSKSSTVALNRKRPGATRPVVTSDGLDEAAAGMSDLVERAFQRRPCDALAAMFLVDVEAGDPPPRTRRLVLLVVALVLNAREFLGAAVLAPSLCGAVVVEDERAAWAPPVELGPPSPRDS